MAERSGTVSSSCSSCSLYVFYWVLSLQLLGPSSSQSVSVLPVPCVQNCTCTEDFSSVDCSRSDLSSVPLDLPVRTVS
ncbi:hypothetical protein NHX12_030373, partial [Muraenolepis orangiensis]